MPKQYWQISLYYPFLDHLITELESRLLTTENRFHAQHLLPRAVDKITNDYVASIYEAYQADIDLSLEDSRREVARWQTSWPITKRNDYVSPHFGGETYCFCPVRLCVCPSHSLSAQLL